MDIIHNACTSRDSTKSLFNLSRNGAQALTKYAKSTKWHNKTEVAVLTEIIKSNVLSIKSIKTINDTFASATILNEPLNETFLEFNRIHDDDDDLIRDIKDQTNASEIQTHFDVPRVASRNILSWIQSTEIPPQIDRNGVMVLFRSMISTCHIACRVVQRKWIKNHKIKFHGFNIANLYDTEVRKWHSELRKRPRPVPPHSPDHDDSQSNVNVGTSIPRQPPRQRTRSMGVTKEQYMREFDEEKNGPLHEQPW
eukprot:427018_1